MIASERRLVTEGETRLSLTKKLALSGRPVKIYVIDPKQFARPQPQPGNTNGIIINNGNNNAGYQYQNHAITPVPAPIPQQQQSKDVTNGRGKKGKKAPQKNSNARKKPTNRSVSTTESKSVATATSPTPTMVVEQRHHQHQHSVSITTHHHHHPIPIAPRGDSSIPTIFLPPSTTLLPLPVIPVSLSLPVGGGATATIGATLTNMNVLSGASIISATDAASGVNVNVNHMEISTTSSSTTTEKKKVKKKKKRATLNDSHRKAQEKTEAAELAFLLKESTTRTGRVSKSSTMASMVSAAISSTLTNGNTSYPSSPVNGSLISLPSSPSAASIVPLPLSIPNSPAQLQLQQPQPQAEKPTAKKRAPPEKFKCITCQKFYVGNAIFNHHFENFPDHVKPDPSVSSRKRAKKSSPPKSKKKTVPSAPIIDEDTQGGMPMSTSMSFSPMLHNHNGSNSTNNGSNNNTSSLVNADILSDNCSSPKLPAFAVHSDSNSASATFPTSSSSNRRDNDQAGNQSNSSNHNEMSNLTSPPREYFMEFQNDIMSLGQIPSDLMGQGSCSQQSFNSLENLLSDSRSPTRNGQSSSSGNILVNGNGMTSSDHGEVNNLNHSTVPVSSNGCINNNNHNNNHPTTFFSSRTTSETTLRNSSVNLSSYVSVRNCCSIPIPSVSPVTRVDEEEARESDESRERERTPSGHVNGNGRVTPNNFLKRRSIWEFVKEQIRQCGINQACGEISEMADKLSRIARDKFYPIQEEELQMDRFGNASPVIKVDTPFISHLLDLPFGAYIFKEDGGIRKTVPPPTPVSTTELSLTNGVEVDVDKFLSPDIDLISLPHLTNLDFNSICQ